MRKLKETKNIRLREVEYEYLNGKTGVGQGVAMGGMRIFDK